MIDVFDLENEISTVLETGVTAEQFADAYADMGSRLVEAEVQLQSLEEAVAEVLSEEECAKIGAARNAAVEAYSSRYITAEMKEKLASYGYAKPVVLVSEAEAEEYTECGEPVFMLGRDGTERAVVSIGEIRAHMRSGGLVGVSQFSVERVMESAEISVEHEEKETE